MIVILIVLFILGLSTITTPDKIGYFIHLQIENSKLPNGLKKMIILCPTCMSSFQGSIIFWTYHIIYVKITYIIFLYWLWSIISSAFIVEFLQNMRVLLLEHVIKIKRHNKLESELE